MANDDSKTTTDHDTIRSWAEARGGYPATVEGTTDGNGPGVLRIAFEGGGDHEDLARIEWDEFFRKFDEEGLALLYQEETSSGEPSRFNKIVSR